MRIVIAMFLALSLGPSAGAGAETWEIGVVAGASFLGPRITPSELDIRRLARPALGGFVAYRIHGRLDAGVEILYAELAVKADMPGVDARFEGRTLGIPLPVRLYLAPGRRVEPYLTGGAQWMFLGDPTETIDGVERVEEGGRQWDVGLLAGAGVRVPLGRGALRLEARYVGGLLDQSPEANVAKLRSWQVLASYGF